MSGVRVLLTDGTEAKFFDAKESVLMIDKVLFSTENGSLNVYRHCANPDWCGDQPMMTFAAGTWKRADRMEP